MLEMMQDIPDADMKLPENILFICKLNPCTTEDYLELIFSRFGGIKSCEVVRVGKLERVFPIGLLSLKLIRLEKKVYIKFI